MAKSSRSALPVILPGQGVLPGFDEVACSKCGHDKTAFIGTDDLAGEDVHECLLCGAETRVIDR